MPQDVSLLDPGRFDLKNFADILPARATIIGEEPGSFERFRQGLLESLIPTTPYEYVVAENLISIEWELLQHRTMRDAGIRRQVSNSIVQAAVKREKQLFDGAVHEAYDAHIEAGGSEDKFTYQKAFDEDAALAQAGDLAIWAVSDDQTQRKKAFVEIAELGLDPIEVMSEGYRAYSKSVQVHETKLPELEQRRREVKRDYDLLQKSRPINGTVLKR